VVKKWLVIKIKTTETVQIELEIDANSQKT